MKITLSADQHANERYLLAEWAIYLSRKRLNKMMIKKKINEMQI